MIEEIQIGLRKQTPSVEGNWLYKDHEQGRLFYSAVWLGKEENPFPECTNEEKEAYERAHNPEEQSEITE